MTQTQKAKAWDYLIARLEELETYDGNRSVMSKTRRLVDEARKKAEGDISTTDHGAGRT
jgi:hypothetical protein